MSHPEQQYLTLLQDILDNSVRKVDQGTGDASYSVFGRQLRFDLSQGFPLLTTKKVYWKGVLFELFWFMQGHTNIKYLVDNNVHIWDDYPYKIYREKSENGASLSSSHSSGPQVLRTRRESSSVLTKEEFIERIASDNKFAK